MLTLVESLSLAGDRAKQNDDACGGGFSRAWVIDGATDLHDTPLTPSASDAAWFAHYLNAILHGAEGGDLRETVRDSVSAAGYAFKALTKEIVIERWRSPIASLLFIEDFDGRVNGLDLGDCRMAALDASGASWLIGGPEDAADAEAKRAAQQTDADKPFLRREATIASLRETRAMLNQEGAHWTACLDPACAEHARGWTLDLARPAHLLLMTDGFSALVDRYRAYDAASLVRAALDNGLQELGRELRAIEAADASASKHPRFKPSDDATALLLRLT